MTTKDLKESILLNDFEACAHAIPSLDPLNIIRLRGDSSICFVNFSKYLLIGPGTGYGISMISKQNGHTIVLCSEGGHMGVPCIDEDHFLFELYVKKRMGVNPNAILSAEWCFCGRGIPLLYEFLLEKEGKKLEEKLVGEDIFSRIDTDDVALKTFNRFLMMLGALLMSNCAVLLPNSGVVYCGNIIKSVINRIRDDMKDESHSYFYKGFFGNKSINSYMKSIPIYFTSETDLSLKGCLVRYSYLVLHENSI